MMRKLMEVYEVDNGLLFKKNEKTYHLFGVSNNEVTESVRIADALDAFEFLANFFVDKFEINREEILRYDRFEKTIRLSFSIKE